MTIEKNQQNVVETSLKEAQVENDLLMAQIHQLEEELENYFIRNKELEQGQQSNSLNNTGRMVWVDEELPDTLAENQRLHALVEVLRKVNQLESNNSLNVKLGNILLQAADSPGSILSVPWKIGKIWRESNRKKIPKFLGDKGFSKVITVFNEGGFESVEKLLTGASIIPTIRANAYTALARQLMNSDSVAAAEAAYRAYESDPKPFRLKWLAFRLHKAGHVIEAEAMLDVLPEDTPFSESEARQASQLSEEGTHVRQQQAKQKTKFSERRIEIEEYQENLIRERDELTESKLQEEEENKLLLHQLFQTQEELESLSLKYQQQFKQLMQAKAEVEEKSDKDIAELKQKLVKLEGEKTTLISQKDEQAKFGAEENELLLHQLFQTQEELESLSLKYQRQVEHLTQAKTEVEEKGRREIDELKQTLVELEEEKVRLISQKDEQVKLLVERQVQVEQLTQAKVALEGQSDKDIAELKQKLVKLEGEKTTLLSQKDEQAKLVVERQVQVEQLTQAKVVLEGQSDKEIAELKQKLVKLEGGKTALLSQKDEQAKLAVERLNIISELQQKIENQKITETELSVRQQMMHEEMVRAEAQLDLIKDMLLSEPGI